MASKITTLEKSVVHHNGKMGTIFKVRNAKGEIRYMLQASSTQYKTKSAAEAACKKRLAR